MGDTFTSEPNTNDTENLAGAGVTGNRGLHFSITKGVPNKVNSDLTFNTVLTSAAISKQGKHPILPKTIVTTDVKSSTVLNDHETRRSEAVTIPRS